MTVSSPVGAVGGERAVDYGTRTPREHIRSDHSFLHNGMTFFVPSLVWIGIAMSMPLLSNSDLGLTIVGIMSILWTIVTVHKRGGAYITPSGVVYLASGVFVGVASLYLVTIGSDTQDEWIVLVAAVAFSATVATDLAAMCFSIRWRTTWTAPSAAEVRHLQFLPPRGYLLKGLVLVAIGATPFVERINYDLARAIGLVGVLMSLGVAVALGRRTRWGGDLLLVLGGLAMPLLWSTTVFRGGGRLILVGVAMAVWMTWNVLHPGRWQKTVVIAAIPIFLIVAGQHRLEKNSREWGVQMSASGSEVISSGAGLESVYDPLDKFGQLVSVTDFPSEKDIGPRYGATFVNTLFLPVPRSSWEGKPKGFGAEITEVMRPHLVQYGQSYAALTHGEWYANFGWLGLVAMPPVLGWVLARLDRAHARLVASRMQHGLDWWRLLVLTAVVAGLGDLFWVGTFGFYSRGGLAALVALGIRLVSRRPAPPAEPVDDRGLRAGVGAAPQTVTAASTAR